MARLRIRVELNRGGVGVPLQKLASVVHESERFFQMLAEDVHIQKDRGEWLAFDFDHESLNFTAEYVGPVSAEQVNSFANAFGGSTSLRRATITQFTRIADAIGEDELIGFGLYHSDHEIEPGEWRCLSRRDALRIADEIQLLMGAAGENGADTHLPSVTDPSIGERMFKDRRDRVSNGADSARLPTLVRELEASLSKRITGLEVEVQSNTHMIQDLRQTTATTEESFRTLLGAVDKFCGQATRQLERLTPAEPDREEDPFPAPPAPSRSWKSVIALVVIAAGIGAGTYLLWPSKSSTSTATAPVSTVRAAANVEQPKPQTPASPIAKPEAPDRGVMLVSLEASQPAWVSITGEDGNKLFAKLMAAQEKHSIELTKSATLRTGNAGGLVVQFNGEPIGALGPAGMVREVQFKDGAFKVGAGK